MKGNAGLAAELWGCIWGLRRAWTSGYRLVQVLCDASQVIEGVYGADIEQIPVKLLVVIFEHTTLYIMKLAVFYREN